MKKIYVEMKEELHWKLKILAAKNRKSLKLLIPELLERELARELKEGKEKKGEKDFEHDYA